MGRTGVRVISIRYHRAKRSGAVLEPPDEALWKGGADSAVHPLDSGMQILLQRVRRAGHDLRPWSLPSDEEVFTAHDNH